MFSSEMPSLELCPHLKQSAPWPPAPARAGPGPLTQLQLNFATQLFNFGWSGLSGAWSWAFGLLLPRGNLNPIRTQHAGQLQTRAHVHPRPPPAPLPVDKWKSPLICSANAPPLACVIARRRSAAEVLPRQEGPSEGHWPRARGVRTQSNHWKPPIPPGAIREHCITSSVGKNQTDVPVQLRNRCDSAMRGLGYGSRIKRSVISFRLA